MKAGPSIGLPLQQLETMDLAFHLSLAPRLTQGLLHGIKIALDPEIEAILQIRTVSLLKESGQINYSDRYCVIRTKFTGINES